MKKKTGSITVTVASQDHVKFVFRVTGFTVTHTIMTPTQLPWLELFLGETQIFPSTDAHDDYYITWHNLASTLFIVGSDMAKIDLRLDREICEIRVGVFIHQN